MKKGQPEKEDFNSARWAGIRRAVALWAKLDADGDGEQATYLAIGIVSELARLLDGRSLPSGVVDERLKQRLGQIPGSLN